jgi:putative transposase
MARPLRIQFPGAWYHVMNRGRHGEPIFKDRRDYYRFIDLLQETADMWNLRIAAYCLMENHYHLLIQTPDANLSRCMRHIDGVYTQRFNLRYDCDGQLFRGRYKSILIEIDHYLLQLVRYIHRNPLKAGLVDHIDNYPWSSHKGYLSKAERWNWLYKDFVLSMLSPQESERVKVYRRFVSKDDNDDEGVLGKILERKKWPSILGSKEFLNLIKEKFFLKKMDDEIPQAKGLAPNVDRIKKLICQTYRIKEDQLLQSKRGVYNEPRNVAIYLTRQLTGESLKRIAEHYRIKKYSSASSVVERMKSMMVVDRKLRKHIENLKAKLLDPQ